MIPLTAHVVSNAVDVFIVTGTRDANVTHVYIVYFLTDVHQCAHHKVIVADMSHVSAAD